MSSHLPSCFKLREVAQALEFLHKKGVIHGDLKPNNVLISSDLHAQVCDFGLASLFSQLEISKSVKTGGAMPYKSPELYEEGPMKTFQSDVYAYGIMIACVSRHTALLLRFVVG